MTVTFRTGVWLLLAMLIGMPAFAEPAGHRGNDPRIERAFLAAVRDALPDIETRAHLEVASWNGRLLLAGQVPDAALRARLLLIARETQLVMSVHDALTVGPSANPGTRFGDALLGMKVKTRLLLAADIPATEVRVVVEERVVYLMGLLAADDAERVVATVQRSTGIRKIVTVFDAPVPGGR